MKIEQECKIKSIESEFLKLSKNISKYPNQSVSMVMVTATNGKKKLPNAVWIAKPVFPKFIKHLQASKA